MEQPEQKIATYIAFLRAINVGGRRVKMNVLRDLISNLGFHAVETYIASGNVILRANAMRTESDRREIERRLETGLNAALGYAVDTFVRTVDEVVAMADRPILGADSEDTIYIGFTAQPPRDAIDRLREAETEVDRFVVAEREIFWICRTSLSQSDFSGAKLEAILGAPATLRNRTTVRRLARKYG